VEVSSHGLTEVLSQHLPGGTEEHHEKESRQPTHPCDTNFTMNIKYYNRLHNTQKSIKLRLWVIYYNFDDIINYSSTPTLKATSIFQFCDKSSIGINKGKVKVKISLLQAVEAHRVVRGQGSHIT
jgi:hypothetical protein